MSSFDELWQLGDILTACNNIFGLPRKLLHAAAHSPSKMAYIFGRLAKEEDKHEKLLQNFSARHFTAGYMKWLFRQHFGVETQIDFISVFDEWSSDEGSSDVGSFGEAEHEAGI
ncbi:uncharacterized protein EAF01_010598 [Botrytis porri]|uniref:uncharacterized protein n=1 Tax=Botrytis porri TaxID=87229 RepID=UPI0019016C80|nr:uncharacterized protein EAF01_010598 [Botrytis porri]KAF7890789.1 hypothetical protein EAF01_010598 [Botrytis porri]